jgi:ribonuclease R
MSKSRKPKPVKANPFVKAVLAIFTNNPHKGYNFRQVAAQLGIQDKASRELVINILYDLENRMEIILVKRGKYQLHPSKITPALTSTMITGTVDMKNTGKAYVITEELGEDVYIAANNTNHALNGDRVKVRLFPKRQGRKIEGQITEILERAKTQFVGVIHATQKYAFLIPDNPNMPVDIFIPLEKLHGAAHGMKAIARITDWPRESNTPFGEITDVLGKPGDNDVEMNSILVEFDFPIKFPDSVEKEAAGLPIEITDHEIRQRRDFRDTFTITIDPEDAKDFDDALSLKKLENGNWEVGVHIADVSWYVRPDTGIDKEAFDRGTSVYLVDRTIPMLPEKLSNNVCSLKPKEDKLCFSAVFQLDDNAHVLGEWFGKTIINSDRRFNYEEVQKMIEGADGDFKSGIMVLHDLASRLRKDRFGKGSIDFRSEEVKFRLDEKGKPIDTFIKENKESNWLIEDFMLLANRRVAEKIGLVRGKIKPRTFVYRIHDKPSTEKLQNFIEFLGKLGYSLRANSRKTLAQSFNQLFKDIEGKGEENMIESIAIRTMAKAKYSTRNIGHYGLGFDFYSHFTSPIRRYPDLMAHRLLFEYMKGAPGVEEETYEEKCVHSSIMERKAEEAERASVKYKQAEYLADKIGQEFNGLISGVSKWGIFVELEGNKCVGMVSLRNMQDDFYYLDEENYRVVGSRYGKEYQLGNPVRIRVKSIDLSKKQMDFEVVETL